MNTFQPSEALLAVLDEAQIEGRIGPGLLERHIKHSLAFAALIDPPAEGQALLDLGSGGGLPGLVLAMCLPGLRVTLLDGRTSRAQALERAVDALDISDRVRVVDARAELAGRFSELRGTLDIVTARAFGAPAVAAECAAPFLNVGGVFIVSEPPADMNAPTRWPIEGCRLVGLEPERMIEAEPSFAILRQVELCPDRFPRRVGMPAKRPIF